MEWVETTAKTVEEAKDAALDRLGVAADEAEFEIVEEPKPGLFGRTRGEGRVRARVRPTPVRPKQERRRRSKGGPGDKAADSPDSPGSDAEEQPDEQPDPRSDSEPKASSGSARASTRRRDRSPQKDQDTTMSNDEQGERNERDERDDPVPPADVGAAAVTFMDGLVGAFGTTGSSDLEIDGIELDVRVTGDELGLLVGPGGRTLNAIQDLARVSAQRRLGDHETRLRIDVAGYRERRSEALRRFASDVAASVRESGSPRALEPMTSADRKVVHDALGDEDGVSSRSEGDDPNRRIVVVPD